MNAANIKSQIDYQEKRLISFKSNLDGYEKAFERFSSAKVKLEQLQKQYKEEFRDASLSYPAKIVAVDSLGLIGVEKVQTGVREAYSGQKERSFSENIKNTLLSIQGKLNREEDSIARSKQNIANTKAIIVTLQKQYALASASKLH
jgi:cysteinyl-tRNA synthetase